MRAFLADFRDFFIAVFSNWQGWVSGGEMGGAAFIILALWERGTGKSMDNSLYYSIILGAFFFGASFVAWRKEHRALKVLEGRLKSPELEGEIMGVYSTETKGQQDALLFVELSIVNRSGPPSAVLDWHMTVETSSRTFTGEVRPLSGEDPVLNVPGGKFTFPYVNYAPHKMMQPIPTGGVTAGWFWSTFEGVRLGRFYEDKAMVVVSFVDAIARKRYRLKKELDPDSYIPGLFTQIKESTW